MKMLKRIVFAALILAAFNSNKPADHNKPSLFISSFENVLGTTFDLKVWANEESTADLAEKTALDEIDRLNAILSSYDPASEFSRWSRTKDEDVKVSKELFEVMSLFDQWRNTTDGALDPAAGNIIQVWKQAEKTQQLPADADLDKAVKAVQQKHWILNAETQTAKHLTDVPLVMNSFVKSYIIRKVADKVMRIDGVSAAVVNIGGDMVVTGDRTEPVRVTNPLATAVNDAPVSTVNIRGRAIATSGNYRRGFSINGKWYSHIVDPRTGKPVSQVIGATVIAPEATDAGALATAFNVLSPDEAKKLAEKMNGAEYMIIMADGKRIQSKGWKDLEVKEKPMVMRPSTLQKPWNSNYEVAIDLELMRFDGRSRRPFVAIWVEDSEKKTVRTVALWFNKPRWLPDLKEWFHKNSSTYQNGTKDVFSIGDATRPAGNYTIKWDGKNDDGAPVSEGTYTVYVEVAREHGTYQLMKQEIVCKNKAQKYTWPANSEVASASVEYRKVTN